MEDDLPSSSESISATCQNQVTAANHCRAELLIALILTVPLYWIPVNPCGKNSDPSSGEIEPRSHSPTTVFSRPSARQLASPKWTHFPPYLVTLRPQLTSQELTTLPLEKQLYTRWTQVAYTLRWIFVIFYPLRKLDFFMLRMVLKS